MSLVADVRLDERCTFNNDRRAWTWLLRDKLHLLTWNVQALHNITDFIDEPGGPRYHLGDFDILTGTEVIHWFSTRPGECDGIIEDELVDEGVDSMSNGR